MTLYDFVTESNRIEGIYRPPTDAEIVAHEEFLARPQLWVVDVEGFVRAVASAPPRFEPNMNVRVGNHFPLPGGPQIRTQLEAILKLAFGGESPWSVHILYECLHPFMDGNGRSGRALWAWMRLREDRDPFALGFLHSAYYEALEAQ